MQRIALILILLTLALPGFAQEKLALVIGNDAYQNVVPLERAGADAEAFAQTLQTERGFEVFKVIDADRATMVETISRFLSRISQDDIVMVFYAGHGVQLDPERRDTLYLLPTDIPSLDAGQGGIEFYLSSAAINFASISLQIAERGARLRVFILDSCRNNPFKTSGTRAIGLSTGIGQISQSKGEFLVFSAAPGEVALDRLPNDTDPNSVFTRVFLKHFRAGKFLEDVINEVQEEVLDLSQRASIEQEPYYTDGVAGKTCLDASCEGANAISVAEDLERVFWEQCDERNNALYCEAYLDQFPRGIYAALARLRIEELTAPADTNTVLALNQNSGRSGVTAEDYDALLEQERDLRPGARPEDYAGLKLTDPADADLDNQPSDCLFCPEMVSLEGGAFLMGSISGAGEAAEQPVTSVTLKPFQISRSEITIGEFRRFIDETGYTISGGCFVWTQDGRMRFRETASWDNPGYDVSDDTPVSCVNWDDAARYTYWLNNVEGGGGYRLPSEAEFEYAARAGSETDYFWGEDPDEACAYVNAADSNSRFRWRNKACTDPYQDVAPVGALPKSDFGLNHMIGNLWEWTADCWSGSHKGANPDGAAREGGLCEGRVLRGGSWDDPTDHLRSSYRVSIPAQRRQANIGFRVAR